MEKPIKFFTTTRNLKPCFGVGNINFRCMKVWRSYHVTKLLATVGMEERNGGGVGKCVWVWGSNTFPHLPHLSLHLPYTPTHFPTPPFIPLPTSPLPPPTPKHIFLLFPCLPSPSQSVAKLPCDEVSVAKLLATICYIATTSLWRSYLKRSSY